MKYPTETLEKAKQFRSEGKSNSEIANALSIPRRTIIRWVKGVPKGGGDMSLLNDTTKSNEETFNTKGNPANLSNESSSIDKKGTEGLKESKNIGGTEGLKELKNICDTEKLNINSFRNMNVTYNPDGGISLESDSKPFKPEPSKDVEHTPLNPKVKPETEVAGGGQQYQTSHMTEHRHIDEPENVMDKFFSRGLVETLVPVGLLLAGFMLKGKKGEKGEFREERGEDW